MSSLQRFNRRPTPPASNAPHFLLNTGGSTLQVHTVGSTLQVPHCRFPIVGSTLLHTTGPHCRFPIVGSTLLHTTGQHCRFPIVGSTLLHTTVVTQRVSLMLSIQLPGSVTGPFLSSCSLRSAFRRVGTARHTCLAPAEAFGCSGIIRVEIGTLCGHVLIVPQKAAAEHARVLHLDESRLS